MYKPIDNINNHNNPYKDKVQNNKSKHRSITLRYRLSSKKVNVNNERKA